MSSCARPSPEDTPEIQIQRASHVLIRVVLEALRKARSGIVDQDVQTAEAAVRCLHHSFDLIPLRHIGGRKDRLDPISRAKKVSFALTFGCTPLYQQQIGSGRRQRPGNSLAHSLTGPGHDGTAVQ